jgi:HD superfamily phosphohydrolase
LVSLVYPAANHTRQEHSLGVFLAAIEFLDRLAADQRFAAAVSPHDAELLLAAALLHDIGHCPFGHPIEDLQLPGIATHEERAVSRIEGPEIANALRDDWGLDPAEVAALVAGNVRSRPHQILRSMLSGPIDVDKIDYLMRDSLHAGVPYGRNFDRRRLIGSLCLNQAGDALAITDKGKTAAEMMVFARYVMFSEVYWHHAVRAATAMFQRAIYFLSEEIDLERVLPPLNEQHLKDALRHLSRERPDVVFELLGGVFGSTRQLYKRLAQYSYFEQPEIYRRLARRWRSSSTLKCFFQSPASIAGLARFRRSSARWPRSSSTTTSSACGSSFTRGTPSACSNSPTLMRDWRKRLPCYQRKVCVDMAWVGILSASPRGARMTFAVERRG